MIDMIVVELGFNCRKDLSIVEACNMITFDSNIIIIIRVRMYLCSLDPINLPYLLNHFLIIYYPLIPLEVNS